MTDVTDPGMSPLDEITDLIDKVARIEHRLADNEKAIFHDLRDKYAGPCEIGFEDKTLLEVLLRNVTVREDKGIRIE